MRTSLAVVLLAGLPALCQQIPAEPPDDQPKLKRRTDLPASPAGSDQQAPDANGLWVIPAGTKIPIQLRQAVSTKNAQPGDPIYGQTTFPIAVGNVIMIPAGTYVKGVVDHSKRAGRIKGKAELQFHLTTLIYPNGYTLDLAAAVDQVPGSADSHMKEPGTITRDSQKGSDVRTIAQDAVTGGQIGAMAGATSGSIRGIGGGGLAGIAAGTLIGVLARGADVRFDIGSGVEVSLNHAIAIAGEKVTQASVLPASNSPAPIITAPTNITVRK